MDIFTKLMQNKQTVKYKFNNKTFPSPVQLENLPFGRKILFLKQIQQFKSEAKKTYISQKRTTAGHAIKEFVKLYDVKEYYCIFYDTDQIRDDTFLVWYKN